MGFFGWNQELEPKEPVSPIARDDDDYDREYTVEDHHSLPTDRAGITPDKYRTVFRLNIAAAVFQAASAGAIFALTATSDSGNDLSFYTNYPAAGDGGPITSPNAVEAFKLNVGWLNGVFLGLSALDHLLVCTCFKGVYERQLSKNYNVFRWIEYAVSASIMRIVVGILSGLTDLHMQFLNFGLTAMTMIFGLVFELENKKNRLSEHNKVRWYLYWLGFIPHFFSWTVVMGYCEYIATFLYEQLRLLTISINLTIF